MIGTAISLLLAIYLLFQRLEENLPSLFAMGAVMIIIATLTLMLLPFLYAMAWTPLERMQSQGAPRVMELLAQDGHLRCIKMWTVLFPLLSYWCAVDLLFFDLSNDIVLMAVWLFLFGITVDVVYHAIRRVSIYLSPHGLLELYSQQAHRAVIDEHYQEVCQWIDALAEMAGQATSRGQISLAIESINELQNLQSHFLHAMKSLTHHAGEEEATDLERGGDIVHYISSYLFERMEMCHGQAMRQKMELVSTHLINSFGKMTLAAAEYDISIATYPLHFLQKITREATHRAMSEVASRASCTLVELAKQLPQKVDLRYLAIAEFYSAIVGQLEENAQEIFKADKSINIAILLLPFKEVRKLFEQPMLADHQDKEAILKVVDGAMDQFQTLQEVMRPLPMAMALQERRGEASPLSVMEDESGISEKIVKEIEERYGSYLSKDVLEPSVTQESSEVAPQEPSEQANREEEAL